MDLTERINLLPDTVRRQILQAVCGNSSSPHTTTPPDARPVAVNHAKDLSRHVEALRSKSSLPAHGILPEIRLTAGVCIVDDFIPQKHVKEALVCAQQALSEGAQQAAIGGALPLASAGRQVDTASRGDIMRWLRPCEEVSSGRGPLAALLERMEALRSQLERQGYSVGGRPTFQLASYPGGGTRYVRHCDASLSCPTRTLTAIVYLNEPYWEPQVDGGCLTLYNVPYTGPLRGCGLAMGEPATVVAPLGGRLVVFESHLSHEVLPTFRNRLWGWLGSWLGWLVQRNAWHCTMTVSSLFSQADHPERVRVGVVWQIDANTESSFAAVAGSRTHPDWLSQVVMWVGVRQVVLPYQDAEGPCKARALAQSLWSGEEFVLQLDSHMRMIRGWDTACIQQLEAAEKMSTTGKAVLSTYPLGYSGAGAAASVPDEASAPATLLCANSFGPDGFLRTMGRVLRQRPAAPLPTYFWAAGLSFTRARWLQEVPYCLHLPHLFFGEESYMLARMWTRGWDVFAPAVPLAFHQWERSARQHTYQRDLMGGRGQVSKGRQQGQGQGTEARERHEQEEKGEQVEQVQAGGAVLGSARSDRESESGEDWVVTAGAPGNGTAAATTAACPRLLAATSEAAAAAARQRSQSRVLYVLRSGAKASPTAAASALAADALVGVADGTTLHGVGLKAFDVAAAIASSGRRDVGGEGDSKDGWAVGQVWGLGTERSLAELAEASGVDYTARVVSARAKWGGLSESAFQA
ncbi:hypothetical protein VOLCADRAFT_96541 [Volvox carteri f. nagariensis]|uniref:Prolyl 4-hydroxylase alpha subunit domain-containing protein n=1 Tax=Volvox carteri f. nagariensis TaxID=3068 RepID=D8UAD7_VOLCA|nr:uncharacterized protein VOLCADRAFT_96541 [Volvox carteri f. nagariensis]EFJ43296.1 hypothetical protein VOLCADRAFT_96541 [Volvox carteri f. nagariensis]|eukprot:XP_002955656.1 hypothetical protein VOLCADRAFT_96541 [Volvox carteri f. nagariensis]